MSRPREFDREGVLQIAERVFWRKGYQASSTEDLRLAMGIGRQSFYDSFGGKRQLYLEVLRRYNDRGVEASVATLLAASSPLSALSALLLSYSKERPERRSLGCMGVAAMCEFGVSDPEVARIGRTSSARFESLLQRVLRNAKARGEVRASLDERAAARQLQATILGLKVMSRAGASPETLRDVALAALEGMAARPLSRAMRAS